ncbi:MAG TPA: sodium/proline symporter, partial [Candidatus Binatia bacterium]|nr:sodium/proline symporter [Candidatus Binatia bacterium]
MANLAQMLLVVVGYFILLITWGLVQGRKVKNDCDYAIAGRKLPGWAAALSERATGESSWALLGLPGMAYATGLTEIWTALGCVAGIVTAWVGLAWRLRDEAEKFQVNTFSDYIAKKHGEMGRWIRMISSSAIVFFFFFYVGAQFMGGGKTLFTLFNVNEKLGMLLTALVIIPYTIYGGFMSVIYTDCVQAVLMIVTLIITPVAGLIYIAKTPGLFAASLPGALRAAGPEYISLTGSASGFAAGVMIAGCFSWFFGYLGGQPQLSMRFMAIKDATQARKARNIGVAWTLVAYLGALAIGWIGLAIFGPHGLPDQEHVLPLVLLKLFPPALAALLITGAIAAMISTTDSLLVLSSSELSENLIKPLGTQRSEAECLRRSRFITACLALVALGLAYVFPSRLIYSMVSYVWAGIGGTFSIVILFTLFWKRYHGRAVIITIVSGLLFTVLWSVSGMNARITSRLLTFFVAGLAAIVATL